MKMSLCKVHLGSFQYCLGVPQLPRRGLLEAVSRRTRAGLHLHGELHPATSASPCCGVRPQPHSQASSSGPSPVGLHLSGRSRMTSWPVFRGLGSKFRCWPRQTQTPDGTSRCLRGLVWLGFAQTKRGLQSGLQSPWTDWDEKPAGVRLTPRACKGLGSGMFIPGAVSLCLLAP